MNPSRTTADPHLLSSRTALLSIVTMFFVNGLVIGAYAGSLPLLRDRLDLVGMDLPILLVVAGVMGITSMQIGGRLADQIDAKRVGVASLPLMATGATILALAPSYTLALVGAAFLGLGNGAMDVAMNAYGVKVEAARRRPVMSSLHAMWSLGNFCGAGLILLIGATGVLPTNVLSIVLLITAALSVIAGAALAAVAPFAGLVEHRDSTGARTPIPPAAWLLGIMAVAFGLAEGTAYDWSAIHVTDVSGVSPSTGALGLVVVAAFMVAVRLVGDRLVTRLGRRWVVRGGGAVAALGYFTTAFVEPLGLVLAGWALVGLGVGMIAPQVYAVAGHMGGGRVLAVVVTFGYATFLAGPALTGGLIALVGIQTAMLMPAFLCASLVFLAVVIPATDYDLQGGH